ncbi:hypothetical protein DSM112329_00238 [Paraconexibacter sp. AEG42_29]|uniref:Uncharacterized protein n=1 Tax=Paraconexibacter sp. AEG42_29 TaxID=2997339 RepID=A0AAU7APA5_9ACTN
MSNDDDPSKLGEGSPRGGEGLADDAGVSDPQDGPAPDADDKVAGQPRGGEGLANITPATTAVPDPDETVQGTPRGGEGLADDAA